MNLSRLLLPLLLVGLSGCATQTCSTTTPPPDCVSAQTCTVSTPASAMIGLDRFGASVIQEAKRAPTFRVLVLNLNETVGSVELHGGGKLLESQHPPGSVVEFERVPLVESNDYTLRLLDRNGIATYTSPPLQLWTPAPCGT